MVAFSWSSVASTYFLLGTPVFIFLRFIITCLSICPLSFMMEIRMASANLHFYAFRSDSGILFSNQKFTNDKIEALFSKLSSAGCLLQVCSKNSQLFLFLLLFFHGFQCYPRRIRFSFHINFSYRSTFFSSH